MLGDEDLHAINSAEHPDRVVLRELGGARLDGTTLRLELPKASWSAVRIATKG